jgi:hypothetical protein
VLQRPAVSVDATGAGKAAVELFRRSNVNLSTFTLTAGDPMVEDRSSYRNPKRDVISRTRAMLQTGRLKVARSLPHASLLARELVNFRFKVTSKGPDDALDWREGPDDDLVLALAIAAWQAERNPSLAFSCGYAVSETAGLKGPLALVETRVGPRAATVAGSLRAAHAARRWPTWRDWKRREFVGTGVSWRGSWCEPTRTPTNSE